MMDLEAEPAILTQHIERPTPPPTEIEEIGIQRDFLDSFSWGYFSMQFIYAIAMRFSWWEVFRLPVLQFCVSLLAIPISFLFFSIPLLGLIIGVGLLVVLPLYISMRFAYTARRLAYERQNWIDFNTYKTTQEKWDLWGKIFFFVSLLLTLISIYISSHSPKPLKGARFKADEQTCSRQAVTDQVLASPLPSSELNMPAFKQSLISCMHKKGYTTYTD